MARMPSTPKRDVNQPPGIETNERPPTMPEQQIIEAKIAPPPTIEVDEEAAKGQDDHKRAWTPIEQDWSQICVRVKRMGGFVKGLNKAGQEKATALMAKYDTTPADGWKKKPYIPRFDNASHSTNQKHLFQKPVTMITVPNNPGT